jgi:bifunctional DNase/RNase
MKQFEQVEIWFIKQRPGGGTVFLQPHSSDFVIPVFIDQAEFQTLTACAGKKDAERPLTQDLIQVLLEKCGLQLFRVEIELKKDLFYARLFFTGSVNGKDYTETEPLVLDARSSDALALSIRGDYPIYIPTRLIDKNGVPIYYIMNNGCKDDHFLYKYQPGDSLSQRPADMGIDMNGLPSEIQESPIMEQRRLYSELNKAIAQEEYERAAEIRDRLNFLNKGLQ